MFTQRKTDSFGLLGTNARNSDCSMESANKNKFVKKQIANFNLENNFDTQSLDCVFNCPPKANFRQSSLSNDPADYLLNSSSSAKIRKSLDSETNVFEVYNNNDDQYNPFETTSCNNNNAQTKLRDSKVLFTITEHDDSTHDTTVSDKRSQFILSPSTSDLEDIVAGDPKLQKLMQDLDFIDQPLAPKRAKKQRQQNTIECLEITQQQMTDCTVNSDKNQSEDEKRRRKNKEQVKILQAEYNKNQNWVRSQMKELAKKVGLKASQVYKWHWDQKKKELDQQKVQRLFYPNEIFQVTDTQGNDITKKVTQKFTIGK